MYQKYRWDSTLIRAWSGGDTTSGPNLVTNGEFSDTVAGLPNGWYFNCQSGIATWDVANAGLSTEPAVYVNVATPGQYPWHIQLSQQHIRIAADSTYRIQFRAKSRRTRPMDVVVQQDRPPWTAYCYQPFNVTPSAQTFLFSFSSTIADTVQIGFDFGEDSGRVWIDDVRLSRGLPARILDPGESLAARTIKLTTWGNRSQYSSYRILDQMRFFYDLERSFYRRVISLLKDTLHVQSLITSSFFWSNELHQRAWSDLVDVMDAHNYFDHPSFPNQPWDSLDFRITNQYLGQGAQGELMFTVLNQCASDHKPMVVTEWQHAGPNESRYVSTVPFCGYQALRDYDAVLCFGIAGDERDYSLDRIRSFFDTSGQPTQFLLLRMAALAFLRDVAPEDLLRSRWSSLDPEVLMRDVYADNYWQQAVTSSPRDRRFNQFFWDSPKSIFTLNTPGSKVFAGRTAAESAALGGIHLVGSTAGTFVASRIDSSSAGVSFLVAVLARTENTGMIWRDSTKTQGLTNWGRLPCLLESVSYRSYWKADSLRVSGLDPRGNPRTSYTIRGSSGQVQWPIRTGVDSVPWYMVTAYGYQENPTSVSEGSGRGYSPVSGFAFGPVSPNPTSGRVAVSYGVPWETSVSLRVYDRAGKLVRTLVSGREKPGFKRVLWDGCDDHGIRVAQGIYLCRLQADARSEVMSIVVTR